MVGRGGRVNGSSRTRRRSRTFGCAAIGLIGAALLVYLLFRYLLLVPPQAIPHPQAPTRAALVHAEQSAQQWRAAIRATEAPPPRLRPHAKGRKAGVVLRRSVVAVPRKIVMQETDINTLIGASLASHPSDLIRDPRLHITPAAIIVSGYVPWQGAYAPIEVNAIPRVRAGRIAFAVQSATLGGLPAPPFVRGMFQHRVDSLLQQKFGRLTGVSRVQLGDGRMEVDMRGATTADGY